MKANIRKALQLCLLALASYVLSYGVGVFLARALGVPGYKAYSVAIATLSLLASIATLGLEKYAVRILPALYESRDWARAHGFTVFGRSLILATGSAVVLGYWLVSLLGAKTAGGEPAWATLLAVLFLPVVVSSQFILEVLAANGVVVRSTAVYRLLLPLCVALLLAAVWLSAIQLTAIWAVACYGIAWVVSLIAFLRLAGNSTPPHVRSAGPVREPSQWLRRSMPFLVHSVMMTQFASLGIVGLEILGSSEQNVAVFAAAMGTGSFVVLLATATNRLYGPIVSLLIERRDYDGMMATIRERHAWIIPATLVYVAAMVLFGKRILGLFGPEFAEGFPALCWIVGGASVSVWFAMAPNYLKFVGRNNLVLGITTAAGGLNVLLLAALGPSFGSTGAGAAYGISLATMALTFFFLSLRSAKRVMKG